MLVDANILLYAIDRTSRFHEPARDWLAAALNGRTRVGFPWLSLAAFVRIATNPRASRAPLSSAAAWECVTDWLACDVAWIPGPTDRHASILGGLIATYDLRGNLITDGQIATLAIEHGLTVVSTDTDFARFREISWKNPLE